jgi:hypothetical protein
LVVLGTTNDSTTIVGAERATGRPNGETFGVQQLTRIRLIAGRMRATGLGEHAQENKHFPVRRSRLKIRFPHGSVGSSPTGGTIAEIQAGQHTK